MADNDAGFFQSIATLIDDFKSPNVSARMNSMRSLKTIANALGVERTREELLPYINECVEGCDDVLCVLAEELGTFLEYVGGLPHVSILLQMLETLGSAEDITIREKVSDSLNQLAASIFSSGVSSPQHTEFYSLFGRMTRSDWPGSRSTGVTLLPKIITAHSMTGKLKVVKETLTSFVTLARDPEPVVRRSVATTFKDILAVLRKLGPPADPGALTAEFLHPVFIAISQDSQDGIRLLAYEVAIALKNPKVSNDVVVRLMESSSWRVRYMGAYTLADLSVATFPQAHTDITLKLLSDSEAEIRSTTISQLGKMTSVSTAVLNKAFKFITSDTSPQVRSSMVGLLGNVMENVPVDDVCEFFGHVIHMATENLQASANATTPPIGSGELDTALLLVRQLGSLVKICQRCEESGSTNSAGIKMEFATLQPILKAVAIDKRWRVREAFANAAREDLLHVLTRVQIDTVVLELLLPGLLTDRVYRVRASAVQTFAAFAAHFGSDWLRGVLPIVSEQLVQSPNYLLRVTAAHACGEIICVGKKEGHTFWDLLLPIMRQLAQDTIANVRIALVHTLEQLIHNKALDSVRWGPLVVQLASDLDEDVKKRAHQLRDVSL